MADEPGPLPPNPRDANPPHLASASELAPAQVDDVQPREQRPAEVSPSSVFVNSQPIREDHIQNAVKFLSHPRVKGSPVIHRRNFLERKGLTKEEIDEAFRRVPDPSPAVVNAHATSDNQQEQPSGNSMAVNPSPAAPAGIMTTVTRRFHWSYALLAIGFFAASGCGAGIFFKKAIIPRFKSWIRKVVSHEEYDVHVRSFSKPSPAEEAAAAAKAAAAAAADVAKASQEMVISNMEEKRFFSELLNLMDVQLQEIRSMRNPIGKLEGQASARRGLYVEEEYPSTIAPSRQQFDGRAEYDSRSVRSSSPPVSADPPHPSSYMEIMAMIQRGERPSNIRDINDAPPNPNQPIPKPSLAPRTKPWETGQPYSTTSYFPQPPAITEGSSSSLQGNGNAYEFNNQYSVPWQPRQQQKNVGIAEVLNGDSPRDIAYDEVPVDRPPQRKWVPPQPPPVALAEAADAIRRPKLSALEDRPADEVVSAPAGGELDELQRITEISESGGEREVKVGGSEINAGEILEEHVAS